MSQLTSLPTEIIEIISRYLVQPRLGFSDDGLLNLRLTCRALCLKASYEFRRAAFSTLRLDLHPKTLQRFLDICRVPAFGGAVKKIVFAHWGDEYIAFPTVKDGGKGQEEEGEGMALEREVSFVLKEIFESAFSLTPNLSSITLITPLVARFRRHAHTLDSVSTLSQKRALDVENFCLPMSELYSLLAGALASTNVHISSLETTRSLMPSSENLWSIGCVSTQSLSSRAQALSDMQHLKISLNASESSNADGYLGDALRNMPLLTRLDLRFHSRSSSMIGMDDPASESPPVLALRALRRVHLPRLETFALGRARVEEGVLREFLMKHGKTLERVAICYVSLEGDAGWGLILALMHDSLERLRELCIATSYNARRGPGTFHVEGREAIAQRLGSILGRV